MSEYEGLVNRLLEAESLDENSVTVAAAAGAAAYLIKQLERERDEFKTLAAKQSAKLVELEGELAEALADIEERKAERSRMSFELHELKEGEF